MTAHLAHQPHQVAADPEFGARLDIKNVSKVFGARDTGVIALNDVSLTVEPGEFVSFLGPSGCGKSTLLRILTGLDRPSSGVVELNGHRVERPESDLGIVFQQPILMNWRTVLGNVLLQTDLRGMPQAEYRERATELLSGVGLKDFLQAYPRNLSGGMRQRVSICRALLHNPPLLVMDGPFGALDALTREQMRIDLERLWLDGRKTVIFITHSIDEAVLLSDRIFVFTPRPGQIDRVISINLPRPRGFAARDKPEVMQHIREISEIFLARGVFHR